MFDWLDQLREKPEHVRFRVAIASAGIATTIIFFVWLSIVSLGSQDGVGVIAENAPRESSPLSAVGAFFGDAKKAIDEGISGLGTIEYEAPQEE